MFSKLATVRKMLINNIKVNEYTFRVSISTILTHLYECSGRAFAVSPSVEGSVGVDISKIKFHVKFFFSNVMGKA